MDEHFEINCTCGAKYEITGTHVSYHTKELIECEFCHKALLRWDGCTLYTSRLISKKVTPEDEAFLKHIMNK